MRILENELVKRILKILLVLLILFLVALPTVFINKIYGYLPIIFLVIVMLLSYLSLRLVERNISVESDFMNSECERGNSVSLGLKVLNSGKIFCSKAIADLYISDLFGGTDSIQPIWLTLAPESSNRLGFDMDMPHIGVYHVGVKDMNIYDYSGMFNRKIHIDGEFEVFVKPRIFDLEEVIENEMVREDADILNNVTVLSGTDYVGVREYEPGDSMKQIHWKLSSRGMGYLTKLHESFREIDFSVILDFASDEYEDRETAMDIYDRLVETALSVVTEVAKNHTSYFLLYCDKERNVRRTTPKGRKDDISLMKDFSVLTENPPAEYPDACEILINEGMSANRCSNVIICTSRITPQLIQEVLRVKKQGRMPEIYQVVPAAYNSKDMENCRAKFDALEGAGIDYHFVFTTDTGGLE